jgi:8-oxo-dGTP pyrophosphatase MutT (NUDIX family)
MADYIMDLRKLIGHIPLVVSVAGVIILDSKKRVLLQHRTDNNTWCIPGGIIEPGETVEKAAKREIYEETGLTIDNMQLFNIYSGKEQYHIYPNGDEVYFINILLITRSFDGIIHADQNESKEVKFFNIDKLPKEITSSSIPVLRELKEKVHMYF